MNENQVFDIIVSHIKEIVPGLGNHNFTRSDNLRDLGANSVDRADIAIMSQESLGMKLPLTAFLKVSNLGEMADVLVQQLKKT